MAGNLDNGDTFDNYPVAEECVKSYKESLSYLTVCRSNPLNVSLVNECKVFCDIKIEKLQFLGEHVSKFAGQKQSCFFTINLIQSLKDDLTSIISKDGGTLESKTVKWLESQTAFGKSIRTGIIKNLRHIDPRKFFADAKNLFVQEIKKILDERKSSLKVYTVLEATYAKQKGEETLEELKHFNTKTFSIYTISDLEKLFIDHVTDPILKDMEEFEQRESGWSLKRIELLNVIMQKYNPMRCGTYIRLPKSIAQRGACINVQNDDDMCFKWAILSALVPLRGIKIDHAYRVQQYLRYEAEFNLDFSNIQFPVDPMDVPKFEKLNNISVNVYLLQRSSADYEVFPCYLTSTKKNQHINLLLLESKYKAEEVVMERLACGIIRKKRKMEILSEMPNYHYVWIKNLSRLLSSQVSKCKISKYFCDRCLVYFHSEEKLKVHEVECKTLNKSKIKVLSPKPNDTDNSNKILKFKNLKNENFGDVDLENFINDKNINQF